MIPDPLALRHSFVALKFLPDDVAGDARRATYVRAALHSGMLTAIRPVVLSIASILAAASLQAQADLGRILPAGTPLRVIAFGDSGSGEPEQKATAEAMGRRHAAQPFNLGLTLGDNFYRCGVRSVTDEKWKTRWEDLYASLGLTFYASLGNHDYGHPVIACLFQQGSPDVQVAYSKTSKSWRMPARYYTYVAGPVRFIALDTEDWSDQQLKWIGDVLRASASEADVRWRIVYGHHAMYSSGKHHNDGRAEELRRYLLPVLKAGGVDLYIAGHDHDLERLHADGMEFLVSGGGGAGIRDISKGRPESKFLKTVNGFLELNINASELTAQFLNAQLEPLDPTPLRLVK